VLIKQPLLSLLKSQDVAVSEVFTQSMFDELCASMEAAGWSGVDEVE